MYTLDVKAGNAMGGCRGGRARAGHRPPMEKNCLAILWAFLLLFLHMGAFLLRFSHLPGGGGGFFTMWGHFCYFLLHGGGLFWACPSPMKISANDHGQCNYYYCFVDRQ